MADDKAFKEGLEDVVAGTSRITDVNGNDGKLIYGGYDIHDLAQNTTFEEVVYLLWHGELADPAAIVPAQHRPGCQLRPAGTGAGPDPAVPPHRRADGRPANRRLPARLLRPGHRRRDAWTPTAGRPCAWSRRWAPSSPPSAASRSGQEPIAPKPGLSIAGNFLYQLLGKEPDATATHALDVALILHADHELNASTFSARVTVATLTDMYSAITSAVGTLAGPLHGGANVNVMHLLEQIGTPDRAEAIVTQMLSEGKKIPGIGHRVYRALDPRAVSLRQMSQQLAETTGDAKWYEMSERVQQAADKALAAKGKTTLKANVDFFSASVYHMLGIPTEQFTPVFAVSRVSGWTAHVLEQLENNRLIRPRAIYTGPRDLKVTPLAQRKPPPA